MITWACRQKLRQQPQEPPADRRRAGRPAARCSPGSSISPSAGATCRRALVTNRVLLFVLWYVNVLLILVVLFVLLRNLIKLIVERRHRVLGSTFKFKLVATYVGLSLIPVLLLFAIATELLQGSMDRWFNTPVAPVLERGNAVAQALYDQIEKTNLRDAAAGARARSRGSTSTTRGSSRALTRRLQEPARRADLDFAGGLRGARLRQRACSTCSRGSPSCRSPDRSFLEQATKEGNATAVSDARPGTRGSLLARRRGRAEPAARRAGSAPIDRGGRIAPRSRCSPRSARSWCRTTRPTASSWCRRTTCGRATCCSS